MKDYKRLTGKRRRFVECEKCTFGNCQYCDDIYEIEAEAHQRLCDLEDKIENGTLKFMPCKVGDKVYMPWEYDGVSGVAELTVKEVFMDSDVIETNLVSDSAEYLRKYRYGLFNFEEIGKIIFLTKAEAEAMLLQLKGERE